MLIRNRACSLRLFQLMLLNHCNIIRSDQHRDGVGDIYSYGPDFPVNPGLTQTVSPAATGISSDPFRINVRLTQLWS